MTAVRYRVEHVTRYVHADGVSTSQHIACLRPRELPHQHVAWHELSIEPLPTDQTDRVDYFGNELTYFAILTPYVELRVLSHSLVDVLPAAPIDPESSPAWEEVREIGISSDDSLDLSVEQFRYPSPSVQIAPELTDFAREAFSPGRPLAAAAVDLMHHIHRECRFDSGSTTVTTPVARVLSDRQGVCQDFAHLFIGCLRSLGLPARYVSGYLLTDPPEGQPRLVGADASHAWISVFCPGPGWIDLDPTNDVMPGERHVTIGWGRDYSDVSPLRGVVLGGAHHTLHVGVSVLPVPPETDTP
jgi:transglutaminase-like putative cysteine protease